MRILFFLFLFVPGIGFSQLKLETTMRVIAIAVDGDTVKLNSKPVSFVAAPISERVMVAQSKKRSYAIKTEILKTDIDKEEPYIIRCAFFERIDGVTDWKRTNIITYERPMIMEDANPAFFEVKDQLDSHYSISHQADGHQLFIKYDLYFNWVK